MKEISLHILDIIENSVKAGARSVTLCFCWSGTVLSIRISDNGPGFPASIREDPSNPFKTTRTERKVGLGLSLLREAAEESGGAFKVFEPSSGGVTVEADFDLSSIDAKPVGDIAELVMTAIIAWPAADFIVQSGPAREELLNTATIREEIGCRDLGGPEIREFITRTLSQELAPLTEWAEKTFRKV